MVKLKRYLPLLVVTAALGIFVAAGGAEYLRLDALTARHAGLQAFVAGNRVGAALIFIAVYAGLVAISFPGASALTILGGLLFGTWLGGGLAIVGATIGATVIFIAAKTAFADTLRSKAGPRLAKLQAGFEANAASYLLTLRLVPAFPFFLINIAAGIFGMRLLPYVLTTAIGIIPGTFVYAGVGAGAGAVVERGGGIDAGGLLLDPRILLPVLGLGLLSLLPVIVKRVRGSPLSPPKA